MYIPQDKAIELYKLCLGDWLTGWFPRKVKPVRNGMYLLRWSKASLIEACRFENGVWYSCTRIKEIPIVKLPKDAEWCGLTLLGTNMLPVVLHPSFL